jgi:hypothetical protein
MGIATVMKDSLEVGWVLSSKESDAPSMDLAEITGGMLDPFRDHITWTGHAWTNLTKDYPKLLIACSHEGHVLITDTMNKVVDCFRSQEDNYPNFDHFVSVQTCQLGYVLATEEGYLHFYEYNHDSKGKAN